MQQNRFSLYAWGVLFYNVAVILWGAYVRATGSGAGCGSHWPLCNGEVIPRPERIETIIEFSHRLSSGLALLLVFGLLIWAWRRYPRRHAVRRAAIVSMVFIVAEALFGAGLVLFELVADNASMARAAAMAVHLVNTFLLLAALTLTAWWSGGGRPFNLKNQRGLAWAIGAGMLGMLILGASGGIAALGDTLFPAESLRSGIAQELSPTAHILIRLRVLHPLIAVAVGAYLITTVLAGRRRRPGRLNRRLANILTALFLVQLIAGAVNVLLLAPIWLQLVHLFLSDLIWITLILFANEILQEPTPARPV